MVNLTDLNARFTQVMPLSTGVYTGLYFRCVNDSRGKKGHSILFDPPIVPAEYAALPDTGALVRAALATSKHWVASPKWARPCGETLDALTLTPSIAYPCGCHWVITEGKATP